MKPSPAIKAKRKLKVPAQRAEARVEKSPAALTQRLKALQRRAHPKRKAAAKKAEAVSAEEENLPPIRQSLKLQTKLKLM